MQIYISGSLAIDRLMSFSGKFKEYILPDSIDRLNVSFVVDGMIELRGGTAGNIAYSMALLDERPRVLASAGKDFGSYRTWLESHGLPMDGVREVEDDFTAACYFITDATNNQINGFNPAAMGKPCAYTFPDLKPEAALGMVSPGNFEDMMNLPAFYRKHHVRYIFDPGQNIPVFSGEQLLSAIEGSHMLISNDYELELILNATGLDKAELLQRSNMIVTTLGGKGSHVLTKGKVIDVPAVKVETVVDPTGAGDSFRAGLLKGMTLGANMETCCRLGAVAASFCVERKGTQEHAFTKEQFASRYEGAFGKCPI